MHLKNKNMFEKTIITFSTKIYGKLMTQTRLRNKFQKERPDESRTLYNRHSDI